MGKATRWFRSLFGRKRSSESRKQAPEKQGVVSDENKHAIAVAAATVAVAEAALAAAHAAAEVVRLTSGGGSRAYYDGERLRVASVVKIQSAFRAYLARRALRALRGLVKLQALVRGHIVRKQSAEMLRRMQAMARVQARACANRAYSSASPHSSVKSFRSHRHPRSSSMSNVRSLFGQEREYRSGPYWLENWMDGNSWTSEWDNTSDKILEVDTWKPRKNTTPTKPQKPSIHMFANEILSLDSSWGTEKTAQTAENNSILYSASRSSHKGSPANRGGAFGNHPNYMANTKSSQARVRSLSAPRQRMLFERPPSVQRHWDAMSERGFRR